MEKDYANITYLFAFERNHNVKDFDAYMEKHWTDCFIYSAIYLTVVFGGQYVMKNRERFELRPYLVAWNGMLAGFSILGAIRTIPELIWSWTYKGFEYSCCDSTFLEQGSIAGVWSYLFVLSKVVELGDTIFIVLRKQPLVFLHWYHHVTVLIYVWASNLPKIATGRYYVVMNYTVHSFMYTYYTLRAMNYTVHSFMYSYYTLRAMRIRLPRWVSTFVTSLQLVQMMLGIFVIIVSYSILSSGRECVTSLNNITFCLLMYASYLVLFLQFFYNTYIVKKQIVHEKKQ